MSKFEALAVNVPTENGELLNLIERLEAEIQGSPVEISDDVLERLERILVTIHGAKFDAGVQPQRNNHQPVGNATAVLVTATELMNAANLEIFELGMWQSWSGTNKVGDK